MVLVGRSHALTIRKKKNLGKQHRKLVIPTWQAGSRTTTCALHSAKAANGSAPPSTRVRSSVTEEATNSNANENNSSTLIAMIAQESNYPSEGVVYGNVTKTDLV